MSVLSSPRFLRNVLLADALSCFACGALQVSLTDSLSALLGLEHVLLLGTGVFLLVYAVVVCFIATRNPVPRGRVWLLVFGNLGWAVSCVGLLFSSNVHATPLGVAYVVLQAGTVTLLAELQWFGLRRSAANRLLAG